jgi:hypothetical protein
VEKAETEDAFPDCHFHKRPDLIRYHRSPAGLYRIQYPDTWTLEEDEGIISLHRPGHSPAATFSAACRRDRKTLTDARKELANFLKQAASSELRHLTQSLNRAEAEYRDHEGFPWRAVFRCAGPIVVLGTVNAQPGDEAGEAWQEAVAIVDSIWIDPPMAAPIRR